VGGPEFGAQQCKKIITMNKAYENFCFSSTMKKIITQTENV
jgi:hypothetical protein